MERRRPHMECLLIHMSYSFTSDQLRDLCLCRMLLNLSQPAVLLYTEEVSVGSKVFSGFVLDHQTRRNQLFRTAQLITFTSHRDYYTDTVFTLLHPSYILSACFSTKPSVLSKISHSSDVSCCLKAKAHTHFNLKQLLQSMIKEYESN